MYRDRHIADDAGIAASKINAAFTETFPTPLAGITVGATLGQMTILNATAITSGVKYLTQGQFTTQSPDVRRDLVLAILGYTDVHITGGVATVQYYRANGVLKTKSITGFTMAGGTGVPGQNVYALGDGVSRLRSLSMTIAGTTLTGAWAAIGPGPKLAVANQPYSTGRIVHEVDQPVPPTLDTTSGLFTPGTTLNGTNNVTITVHYGSPR